MLLFMSNFLSVFVLATHPAVLLALGSGITSAVLGGPLGMLGIQLGLAVYKASALPTRL